MKLIKPIKNVDYSKRKAVIINRLPERKISLKLFKDVHPPGKYIRFPLEILERK